VGKVTYNPRESQVSQIREMWEEELEGGDAREKEGGREVEDQGAPILLKNGSCMLRGCCQQLLVK